MKLVAALAVLVIANVNAADVTPPALPQPAPYGAYFLDVLRQTPSEQKAARDAIARHYGYKDEAAASKACVAATRSPFACADAVRHRRKESPEIAKYGFETWEKAVHACMTNYKPREFGPFMYCDADPFLKLRTQGAVGK